MHGMVQTWFHLVEHWGYLGVFLLMALESSIVPVPSEIVIPPAAYWAAQGRMDVFVVVLVGTLGSLFGSLVMYAVSLLLGRPFVYKYGKYFLMNQQKIEMSERFIKNSAAGGIFFSRLIPVVRHLCSIPAGLARMDMKRFAFWTTFGAGLWCGILAWFGNAVIGNEPNLMNDPTKLMQVLKAKLIYFGVAAFVLLGAYLAMKVIAGRQTVPASGAPAEPPSA